jgi:hypothetical protein
VRWAKDGDGAGAAEAIGTCLVSNAFIARLCMERYVAGRSQNSLVAGLARQGADIFRKRR